MLLTQYSYLFNPFTIATCIARPTSILTNTFILSAIANAANARSGTFVLALSAASYLSLYPILLFPPLLILCYDQTARRSEPTQSATSFATRHITGLAVAVGALIGLSYLITGSWQFLSSTYGTYLLLPDLTPNVGLWWYFFIEMFDSFREFFLGVFWLHMASYVGGLSLRFQKQPLFAIVAMLGIIAVFQPYPSIADTSLFLGVVPLYRHLFPCEFLHTPVFVLMSSWLMPFYSDAILLPGDSCDHVRYTPRTGILPPVDLCRVRKRKFLLRYHVGVEFGSDCSAWGYAVCSYSGRIRS